ncbi:hypothetical protein JVT61DRAFT_751 [Boletus reticuloceps]|uniref:Uncharacterized protein n=1 Tax=Boletus reticuloceps TaxID=495285 RepID=A0A8I2Z397_9AGAM|nr:hypothetical protein JVT61DRAFT_751 [Boletus reticuloceps]
MTPPVLLTVPTPLNDCHPHHATSGTNDTQRHVALPVDFGILVDVPHPSPGPSVPSAPGSFSLFSAGITPVADATHPLTSNAGTIHNANANANATLPSDSDCSDAHAYSDTHAHAVVQRQWTGAPIRAIVPLPRRMRASPHGVAHLNAPTSAWSHSHSHGHSHTAVGPPTRSIRDDADVDTDSDSEIKIDIVAPEEDEDEDEDEDDAEQGRMRSRYYSYESITATEGLSAWSFEELRVECYGQSLIARGTRPSPMVQPSLAIPPAFVPRVIPRR